MYQKAKFRDQTEEQIKAAITEQGFYPIKITDLAGKLYTSHAHPTIKLLVFLAGDMTVKVEDQQIECQTGDKLIIDANLTHSAVVGPDGCTFFWSEKISD